MDQVDRLSQMDVNLFIQNITHLPFQDVITICNANETLLAYCDDSKYNNLWKSLIDSTFSNINNYDDKLQELWNKTGIEVGIYNYLVYTQLVNLLDPITQGMIYYRQGDMDFFDRLSGVQKFLALFLLGKKNELRKYLPNNNYISFIALLNGGKISQDILNNMLIEMAKQGSLQGMNYFIKRGADIHSRDDWALRFASQHGHLEMVIYLIENGANVNAQDDFSLRESIRNGHLEIVKYLVEHGANVNAWDDQALRFANEYGHLEIMKYLVEHRANVNTKDDLALIDASRDGNLKVVKFLIEHGANVNAQDDWALRAASSNGNLEVVRYLMEHGANIHTHNEQQLMAAINITNIPMVQLLLERGADIHVNN